MKEVIQQHLNVKIIKSGELSIRATDVPYSIISDLQSEPVLGLIPSEGSYHKMELYYFGDTVEEIAAYMLKCSLSLQADYIQLKLDNLEN